MFNCNGAILGPCGGAPVVGVVLSTNQQAKQANQTSEQAKGQVDKQGGEHKSEWGKELVMEYAGQRGYGEGGH